MRILLTLEYNGSAFSGWQKQDNLLTVQGELERAVNLYFASLEKKYSAAILVEDIVVQGSGRTDAGVHALGQTADFTIPDAIFNGIENSNIFLNKLSSSLNGISNKNVKIVNARFVSNDFHARMTPHNKCYLYKLKLSFARPVLDDGFVWCVGNKLDLRAMIECAHLFKGQYDFSAFRASDCNAKTTVRTIKQSELVRGSGDILEYFIVGSGFLKQMVRIIVGTLVDVGLGKISLADVKNLLENGNKLTRDSAGQTAPPQGLYLNWVNYL